MENSEEKLRERCAPTPPLLLTLAIYDPDFHIEIEILPLWRRRFRFFVCTPIASRGKKAKENKNEKKNTHYVV